MRSGGIKFIALGCVIAFVAGTLIILFARAYRQAHESGYWNSRSNRSWKEGSREWMSLGLSRGATEELVERAIASLGGGAKVTKTLRHQVLASEPGRGNVDIYVVEYPSAQ